MCKSKWEANMLCSNIVVVIISLIPNIVLDLINAQKTFRKPNYQEVAIHCFHGRVFISTEKKESDGSCNGGDYTTKLEDTARNNLISLANQLFSVSLYLTGSHIERGPNSHWTPLLYYFIFHSLKPPLSHNMVCGQV